MAQTHVSSGEVRGKRYLRITGNTFDHKGAIKSALPGARWSKADEAWVVQLAGLPHGQAAKIASETYKLGKLGLRFELE